jgi:outer membrane protein assembly factor BamB
VLSTGNELLALSLECGSGGGSCSALWVAHPPATNLPPVVGDGVVYQAAGANLYAYPVSCGTSGVTCAPLWIGSAPSRILGPPAVAGGLVYVTSKDGSLSAFDVGCGSGGSACSPMASRPHVLCRCFGSTVVVTRGVLYVVTDEVVAYPESCALASTCRSLWKAGPYQSNAGAAITDDAVYVTTNQIGGHLYAFELPPKPSAKAPAGSGGVGMTVVAVLVYGGLGFVLARVVLRRLRRRRALKGASIEPIA